uniref:Uncharacterized protein n=1 Tax=Panagrolaimus davidi TaxID=227884 RepID=A0A914QVL6_9BILA
MALSSPQVRFSGPHRPQQWSLPDNTIYYITTNPLSAKVYQKLTKTCKYFYSKNPITVCAELNSNSEENKKDEDKEFLLWLEQNAFDFNCRWEDGIRKFIDLNTIPDKLWITDNIEIFDTDLTEKQNLISFIFPKIYRCDIKSLCLQDQNISFSQFLFLSSNVESLHFGNVIVKNKDENIVSLEKLVETAVKIQTLKL